MSNIVAIHPFKSYSESGIVIVKTGGMYGVGNWQDIRDIGIRYIIRKRFATLADARAAANRGWAAGHHDAISAA